MDNTHCLHDTRELGHCLVTGGAGFLGRNLVKTLLDAGCRVTALVSRTPLKLQHPQLTVLKGDICNAADMQRVCKGVDTVFHTAALIALLGGRFASKQYRQDAWSVNVEGTQNVIDACKVQGVQRLIYTSSVDVVFDGQPLPSMNETMPYAQRPKSVYAATKIEAERRVLKANGEQGLLTCAIRPDGIYGAEPNEMIDRFYGQLAAGRLQAKIGDGTTLQDNSQIANLVHGEILAARHLVQGGVACGQAYFIGDAEPMNSFEFFRPLIEGLGYTVPQKVISPGLLGPIVTVWQALHFLFGAPKPMLCPHELDKITVTHYASIDKARRELGYAPVINTAQALAECVEYCKGKQAAAVLSSGGAHS
jgi:3beta-hydroxy-Delta5-steroid dehydrogenase / steroid Delta-isomerase